MYLDTILDLYKGKANICLRDCHDNEICTAPIESDVFYHYDNVVLEWKMFGDVISIKIDYEGDRYNERVQG